MKTLRLVSVLGLFLGISVSVLAQTLTFTKTTLAVGSGPNFVLAADLTGDGRPDLVCPNFGFRYGCVGDYGGNGSNLTAWFNNGHGAFTSHATIAIPYLGPADPTQPTCVAAADFNGTGRLDLVEPNFYYNTLSILTNNGQGIFKIASGAHGSGRATVFLTTADVNGDGKPDIITVNNYPADSNISVVTNAGNYVFTNSVTLFCGYRPAYVVAADFNGDGNLDLVSANYGDCGDGNTLTVFFGNGQGQFTTNATLTVGYGPICLSAADVNGDGKVDLVCANQAGNSLSILTNDGFGNFTLKSTISTESPSSVVATNISGSGYIDLACANSINGYVGSVSIFTNDGHGNFGANTIIPIGASDVVNYPDSLAAADFNGDGKMDLVVANYGSASLTVLTQAAPKPPPPPPVVTITSPANGAAVLTTSNLVVKVTTGSAVSEVNLLVDGQLSAGTTVTPYNLAVPAGTLAPGGHTLQAVAVTSGGTSGFSPVINITVNAPGTALIDFDALNTSAGDVGGTALAGYLAQYGVTMNNVTAGTVLEAVNTNSLTGTIQVDAPSAPNFFTQAGLNTPVSFTLNFATALQSFGFARAGLSAASGPVSHPQWTATIFDRSGTALGSVSEALMVSASAVAARSFVLTGANIASVRFDSDSQGVAAFSAVLLDNLLLNSNPTAPELSATLAVVSPNPNNLIAPATMVLGVTVTDNLSSSYSVSYFAGANLLGTVSASPYQLTVNNVLAGNYALQARVTDASGVSALSPVVPVTVQLGANASGINFDTLNTAPAPVTGAAVTKYLAGFGVTVVSLSPGTALTVDRQQHLAGGKAVAASSPPNLMTQTGSNGPVQFTLGFAPFLSQFGFTRPALLANPLVSHPAWQVIAFDGAGNVVGQVGEAEIDSSTNVGAMEFSLGQPGGPGIAKVEFASEGSGLTTFNAMLLDDLVLTKSAAAFLPAVALTSPSSGLVLAAPPALTITAAASDATGITSVSFYANGALLGTDTASPYSIQWTNIAAGNYVLTAVASDGAGLTQTSVPVNVIIQPSAFQFGIASPPASQTVALGGSVTFSVGTTGTNGVAYQWSHNQTPITGATANTLVVGPPIADSDAGTYTVTATVPGESLTSDPAYLTVVDPPVITTQPAAQMIPTGSGIVLTVAAAGGPFTYQWRLNGTGIPGATNNTYAVPSAQPLNSGNYQVAVANLAVSTLSAVAPVIVETAITIPATNNTFASRAAINPLLGPVAANNQSAVAQLGAPLPDNRPGGNSIWFSWTPAFTGTVSLTTQGSAFDTIMAVYTGSALNKLKAVAADDDSGGFLTSLVTFNVTKGTNYQIAVDGFQGASGRVVLGLPAGTGYRILNPTSGASVPVIVKGPASQAVAPGAKVTLSVQATSATKMSYQWHFQGTPIAGATGSSLVINQLRPALVGLYDVLVANAAGSAQSEPANVQIASNPGGTITSTQNKFINTPSPTSLASLAIDVTPLALGGDTRGFSVSQVFSTVGAVSEPGEPQPCGQVGTASQWFVYTAPGAGRMQISTAGSTYNTMIGVYTGPGTSFSSLVEAGCGYSTNYGVEGQPNVVIPEVVKGTTYYILVAGYQGASGVAQLQIGLGQTLTFSALPASKLLTAGSNTTFAVTTQGSTPSSYQWQLNGANVAGGTKSSYTVTNAQAGAVGNYTVIVSNVVGAVTSSPPAALTLQYAPAIVTGPTNETVTLGHAAKFAVTAMGVNVKTNPFVCQWYFNGAPIPKATSLILSIPATHWTNNGSYSLVISNSYGSITSAPAVLTVRDTTSPTVAITSPANNFVSRISLMTASGTAADNVGVAQVQVQVNTDPFQMATGTNSWSIPVGLDPGTNVVSARSVDLAGNFSVIVKRTIIYEPLPTQPAVQNSLPQLAATSLSSAAGIYSGLFYPSNGVTLASAGFFTATLAGGAHGAFSANILLDGGGYPFTGQFDAMGNASVLVPRDGQSPVAASLHLNLAPADGRMTGVISNADWISVLQASRAVFDAITNPAPIFAGQFTLLLASGTNPPVGNLTVTNTADGTAYVAGTLADGATIFRAAPMGEHATIPLYVPLYSGQDLFLGWLTLTNPPVGTNFGQALWLQPGKTNGTGILIVK